MNKRRKVNQDENYTSNLTGKYANDAER